VRGSASVPDAWADVLRIPRDHWSSILRSYSLVLGLPDEIALQVRGVDPSLIPFPLAMSWEPAIRRALEIDFSRAVPLKHLLDLYDAEALTNLRWCHEILSRHYPSGSLIQRSALDGIREKIHDLEAALVDPGIDSELCDFLRMHAGAMARAVDDVPIRGRAGLEEAVDQVLGDVYIRRARVAERDPRRVELLLAVVQAILLALQISLTGIQIEQASRPPLPQQLVIRCETPSVRPALPPGQSVPPRAGKGAVDTTEPALG
jgi:hypothetical protein